MSKIAFTKFGLVGIDVKRHQTNSALPCPAITIGNDKQDRNCEDARLLPTPSAIKIPSGGPFAYLCKDGHMVTGPINKFVRGVLRHQFQFELTTKKVQGKIARLVDSIYIYIYICIHKPTMDIRA